MPVGLGLQERGDPGVQEPWDQTRGRGVWRVHAREGRQRRATRGRDRGRGSDESRALVTCGAWEGLPGEPSGS